MVGAKSIDNYFDPERRDYIIAQNWQVEQFQEVNLVEPDS
jgi:hypothetical protein